MRPRISIRASVRPSVRPSVRNAFFSNRRKRLFSAAEMDGIELVEWKVEMESRKEGKEGGKEGRKEERITHYSALRGKCKTGIFSISNNYNNSFTIFLLSTCEVMHCSAHCTAHWTAHFTCPARLASLARSAAITPSYAHGKQSN